MLEGSGDSPQYALDHLDPDRIRKAREREGLTGKSLAEKIGKTPSAVSQFEAGVVKPDLNTLVRLSMALGVPTVYFAKRGPGRGNLSIPFDACHFRARKSVSQRARRASIRSGEQILELVELLEERRINFPPEDITPFISGRPRIRSGDSAAIESTASALRAHWGLGFGPVSHLLRLLESKGIFVLALTSTHEYVDAYSAWVGGKPCMMLALSKSASRARFDAGHELGHLILHDDTHPLGVKMTEDEANRFAGAFLAPQEAFYAECPTRWSLAAFLRLKDRWRMSVGALVRRAYDLGRLSESSYRRAFQQLTMLGYRTGEPGEWTHERPGLLSQGLALLEGEETLQSLAGELSVRPLGLRAVLERNVDPAVLISLDAPPRKPDEIGLVRRMGPESM